MAETKKTAAKAAPKQTKKATEVKTIEQLREELAKVHAEQLESRKSHRQGDLINPHVLTVQRKSIARLHTAIRSAEIAAVKEEK